MWHLVKARPTMPQAIHVASPCCVAHWVPFIMTTLQPNPAGSLQARMLQAVAQAFASCSPENMDHCDAYDTLPGSCTTYHGLHRRLALLLPVSNSCIYVTEHVQCALHHMCRFLRWSTECTRLLR